MKLSKIIIIIFILLLVAAGAYWYLFFYGPGNEIGPINNDIGQGFTPLNAPSTSNNPSTQPNASSTEEIVNNNTGTSTSTTPIIDEPMPALRLLSENPIGGYGASTTASTTVIRWIDRGRGNVLEAKNNSSEITVLSNTVLPKMNESVWNKNLTAFIGALFPSNSDIPTVVYARLEIQSTSTKSLNTVSASTSSSTDQTKNLTPYSLKGKNLPENMLGYAVSPKGDKIFMLIKENNQSAGYISNFDGTSVSKIFINPLTQVNVEWPEENTIAITTKGSGSYAGYLYFVNTKTGLWKKILGPISGLSTKVSRDAKYILASGTGANLTLTTNIYTVGTTTYSDASLRTLADKCVWGNFYKEIVYCATPFQQISANYPDDWYKGTISTVDKIWQLNVKTGDIRLISSLIDQADRVIDAFNLGLDNRDEVLLFMNKNDLTFWSLDL